MAKRTAVIFVLAFLITLVITAPASLLDWGLQHATKNRLLLANASGTVWNGSATPSLHTQDNRFLTLPFLHWEISVRSILTGKVRIRLLWDDLPPASASEAVIAFNQIELSNIQLQLPARVMEEASPMLKPAQFRGQLQIQSNHLVFSNRGMEGAAVVNWREASSALSTIAPLGDYRLALNGSGGNIHIGLTTNTGMLLLDGDGNWKTNHGLEFHGKAQAAAGNNTNLAELLNHLGPESSPGVHSFNLIPP